jgi:4-amino-4-deoxy-L-arabinose transferase-like glycosyltransferase
MFWLAEAVGILLKGPPAPVVALSTILSLSVADRDRRWIWQLRPLTGILIVSLVVGPWAVAVESATDGRFLSESILRDFLPKVVGAQESHGAPPGYYTALVMASFWPGSLLIAPALVKGWRRRRAACWRFLLAWLAPAWILFELVPTKLPHYVLPLYPALALLAGAALAEGLGEPLGVAERSLAAVVKVLWGLVTVALVVVLTAAPGWLGGAYSPVTFGSSAVLLGLALAVLLRAWPPLATAGLVAALAATFVLPAALSVAPELDSLWLSRSAAALVAQHPPLPGKTVLSVGYSEPSLVFLLGTTTRLVTASPGDQQLADAGLALVSDRYDAEFRRSLTTHGISARAVDRVTGLDYSAGGSRVVLTLYDLEPK